MAKKKEPLVRRTTARVFIDRIAPTHSKISCTPEPGKAATETTSMNAAYKEHDGGACFRCTLMEVHNLTRANEDAPEKDEDDE